MYQFYYADQKQTWERGLCKENIRERFHITAIRPAMWEEHCLECSAPACFESCAHYQSRSDGRCKRFENGLHTFADERACCGQGAHVKFRKWGNMMTVLFPAMLDEAQYAALWKKNESLGKFLGGVEHSHLPQALRWQGIRVPEYIRRRNLRKLQGMDNHADAFLFQGYSYLSESYRLIIEIYEDHDSVWKTSITIQPGENLAIVLSLADACSKPGNLVKVYPENNVEAELDILWCDFVRGVPAAAEQPAAKVKCMAWDLDNTLWNGTLIETEDPAALALNSRVLETMEELDRRGIIQSVASKNDFEPAMDVLRSLGIADYFLYPQISWVPKSTSIAQIAKSLNIGIDTLALIDDSAFERHQVHSEWPQVRTYDVTDLPGLLERTEFDVPVTAESRQRREMYRAEEQRNTLMQAEHTDILAFLRQCNLKLHIFSPTTEEEKLRCYELILRTNQLNMSGRKYSAEEFDEVLARRGHTNFAFSCEDDFGTYGIVGFGQYHVDHGVIIFTEFAMSCRVAGKFVESALFSYLLKSEGCQIGSFSVLKTKKNALLRRTLEQIGFTSIIEDQLSVSYSYTEKLVNAKIVTVEGVHL